MKPDSVFWASAAKVALHFGFSKSTAHKAMRTLRKTGLFEWQGVSDKGTNRYRVISHKDWAQKHPGQCVVFKPQSERSEAEEADEIQPQSKPKATRGPAGKRGQNSPPQAQTGEASGLEAKPDGTSLARELTFVSGGQINFQDKHRTGLAAHLKEFTAGEVTSAFKSWLDNQDLSDPKNVSFLPGQFVQVADGLAYSARKRRQEAAADRLVRDAAVIRMSKEAEAERQEAAKKREEEDIDPLGLFGECTDAPGCVQ